MIIPKTNLVQTLEIIEGLYDGYCNRIIHAQNKIEFYQQELNNKINSDQKHHMREQLRIWSEDERQLQYNRIDLYSIIRKMGEFVSNYHECKYCERLVKGSDDDVLCPDCKQTFGHERFSEL
jgi:rubrerythrin